MVGGQVSTCGGGLLSSCIAQRFSAIVALCGGALLRCGVALLTVLHNSNCAVGDPLVVMCMHGFLSCGGVVLPLVVLRSYLDLP